MRADHAAISSERPQNSLAWTFAYVRIPPMRYTCRASVAANSYSAQHDSFSGSLKREMATIFSASAIVGNTCSKSM